MSQEQDGRNSVLQNKRSVIMKGLSKEVKSAIIIGIVIVLLLVLGIIYGQKEKTEVAETPTTTVTEITEETTVAPETTTVTVAAETTTSAQVTVPEGAALTKIADGNWELQKDGAKVGNFTGIAENNFGKWYVENGSVNFGFSGKVVFNGVTYDVENGKVTG